jgi:hypothetical protein
MHNRLDPLLLAQLGLVTRRQGWDLGVSTHEFDSLLARQLLVPVHRGVFRDPAAPKTTDQRGLAAVLAAGAGAVVSHRLSVAVWGTPNYKCLLTEITAPGVHNIPDVIAHRSLRPPDQTVLRGVPITTTARTILDVAPQVSAGILGRWTESWLSSKLLTLDDLESQMDAVKGHHGIPLTRLVLNSRTLLHATADSAAEAALGILLESYGLPPLTLHHLVTLPNGLVFELDWSYPDLQIAFEMDGYGVHLRSLDAFEHDRFRRNELEIDGWKILNFTKRQVERKQKTVIDQARRAVRSRV